MCRNLQTPPPLLRSTANALNRNLFKSATLIVCGRYHFVRRMLKERGTSRGSTRPQLYSAARSRARPACGGSSLSLALRASNSSNRGAAGAARWPRARRRAALLAAAAPRPSRRRPFRPAPPSPCGQIPFPSDHFCRYQRTLLPPRSAQPRTPARTVPRPSSPAACSASRGSPAAMERFEFVSGSSPSVAAHVWGRQRLGGGAARCPRLCPLMPRPPAADPRPRQRQLWCRQADARQDHQRAGCRQVHRAGQSGEAPGGAGRARKVAQGTALSLHSIGGAVPLAGGAPGRGEAARAASCACTRAAAASAVSIGRPQRRADAAAPSPTLPRLTRTWSVRS